MQNFKIVYSDEAIGELREIHDYIAEKLMNPEAARQQSDRIMLAIEALGIFPKLYRVRGRDSQRNEIRILPVDNYLILYSVDDEKQIVNVSRVIYGRKNIHLLFAPEY
ncbi:MAG: type II toxin-antitoxin system RelE/ParE family toxin [Synergistaceae bacterium]|nr:type II toxin-antitoxin system RelE/ParE family toxin [Synergistaceae bacterium]MBR0075226.1 type II toxin-antitoxin system RelE/ParE family toxin [Synergistaceae bacterium]